MQGHSLLVYYVVHYPESTIQIIHEYRKASLFHADRDHLSDYMSLGTVHVGQRVKNGMYHVSAQVNKTLKTLAH